MRARSIFALIAALMPVVYCGGLAFHFIEVGGSVEGATAIGLGPTILGLTVVGLLFFIPIFFKLSRLLGGSRSPSLDDRGPDEPAAEDKTRMADAMIARYMAQRSREASVAPSAPPAVANSGRSPKAQGFGRRPR